MSAIAVTSKGFRRQLAGVRGGFRGGCHDNTASRQITGRDSTPGSSGSQYGGGGGGKFYYKKIKEENPGEQMT